MELQLVTEVITAPEWLIHYQLNGSNDIEIAMKKGLFQRAAVCAELGEVILGAKAGRETPLEMTLFDSTGVGIQDAAAASLVYEKAKRLGIGKLIRMI